MFLRILMMYVELICATVLSIVANNLNVFKKINSSILFDKNNQICPKSISSTRISCVTKFLYVFECIWTETSSFCRRYTDDNFLLQMHRKKSSADATPEKKNFNFFPNFANEEVRALQIITYSIQLAKCNHLKIKIISGIKTSKGIYFFFRSFPILMSSKPIFKPARKAAASLAKCIWNETAIFVMHCKRLAEEFDSFFFL